jgi:hypothetical protein
MRSSDMSSSVPSDPVSLLRRRWQVRKNPVGFAHFRGSRSAVTHDQNGNADAGRPVGAVGKILERDLRRPYWEGRDRQTV